VAIRVRPMLKGDIGKEIVVFPLKQVSYILNILIIQGKGVKVTDLTHNLESHYDMVFP
jgi:hypothetical protein